MLWIELGLILLSLLVASTRPGFGSRWFEKIERRLLRLANRRAASVALVGTIALILRAAVLPMEPIPEPVVHDEFGYLLAADTFAHGRLTNPTHPMWVHFETFSVLQKPTYQGFAAPLQGMMLALGKVAFGAPFWGVWLSTGLMCAAITWMLQGWLPATWALVGGIIAVLRYGVFGYWADSYWGGAVGAIGGALVLGALPRIKQSQHVQDSLLLGLGLAILANSRPFEGFAFSLPIAILLLTWLIRMERPKVLIALRRVVAPLAIILLLSSAGTAYYFWRVTGSPLRMPYQIERKTYGVAPYFVWQHLRPEPEYHHAVMRKMYGQVELTAYNVFRSTTGLLLKIYLAWGFFLGPALTLPFIMLIIVLPRNLHWHDIESSTLVLLFIFAVCVIAWDLETFYNLHYSAPATGLFLLLMLLSLRSLRYWGPIGLLLSRAIVLTCLLSFGARVCARPLRLRLRDYYEFAWHQVGPREFGRAMILKQLQRTPGKHLVIVRYQPKHEPFAEWVYNEADIDNSKVVWAREMDAPENQALLDYFKDREVWLLEADETPPRLTTYTLPPPFASFEISAANRDSRKMNSLQKRRTRKLRKSGKSHLPELSAACLATAGLFQHRSNQGTPPLFGAHIVLASGSIPRKDLACVQLPPSSGISIEPSLEELVETGSRGVPVFVRTATEFKI